MKGKADMSAPYTKQNLFADLKKVYSGKRVVVTGDTGFKGSWLCIWLKELGAEVYGFALPAKTKLDNYEKTELSRAIHHRDGDVRDTDALKSFLQECKPEFVFHLAAQSLVIDSYRDPRYTFETNVVGTVNFLEAVRDCSTVRAAVNVTTDKCYHNNEWVWGYRETDPLGGKDPYSASKACSELVTASYVSSFFSGESPAAVASARAGNVIGGGDWADNRIIPDIFRALHERRAITVRNPRYVRPWQFVLEPLGGYLMLGASLSTEGRSFSGSWNFGPSAYENYSVMQVVQEVQKHLPELDVRLNDNTKGPHEAGFLRLDISKAVNQLHWSPRLNFEQTIAFTVKGYQDEIHTEKGLYERRVAQIMEYCAR